MSTRLSIVVFGATGFTGKYVVSEVLRHAKDTKSLTWGIAGRSKEKLEKIIEELENKTGDDLKSIPLIIADVTDEESLQKMAERAKVVVNCCGPYRFYGEPVVKACIGAGTHHVDISGEPQYMEQMQLEYNKIAEEKGVYIVSACGADSIPADMGTIYVQNKFEGTVNSVEVYLDAENKSGKSGVHYGTWESAVYGLAYANELKSIRQKLFAEKLPSFKPVLENRSIIHTNKEVTDKWCLPFPGSDRSVVRRSQRILYENEKIRPIKMRAYFNVDCIISIFLLSIFTLLFGILSKFKLGRKLLLKYPGFFSYGFVSHEGPSEESMENTYFSFTLYAKGWSSDKKLAEPTDQFSDPCNKVLIAKVSGKNPGYGATATMLVLSAVTVLNENDKMPKNGGVLPPGAAFAKTSLIEQLNKNGITFEIVSSKEI